jgi:hypothetical protein
MQAATDYAAPNGGACSLGQDGFGIAWGRFRTSTSPDKLLTKQSFYLSKHPAGTSKGIKTSIANFS